MYNQNIQQYQKFIQGFSTLFDEIKKEGNSIYNSRIGFRVAKFLIEHPNWNFGERNKAHEMIFQGYNKIKESKQKLQNKAKEVLNEYIYSDAQDSVKEVSIYGNHASIELEDNKKEFKISEFLNSDFCQKNGISGFSTLHSDGKNGMHGFIAEEGKEKRKVRHYVVTDGAYEMTLNWYVNGEKFTIKVNIDKEGVDLIEPKGVTAEQLEANKDVKIGGLFLHEIEFKKRGKTNEVQHEKERINMPSSETVAKIDVNRDVSVQQITQNREIGSQNTISRSSSENDLGYKSQRENSQKKRTPPPPPLRTSSLLPKANEQASINHSGEQRDKQNNSAPNNQQKGEYQLTSDPSNSSTFVSQNQNDREEDKRSTFTTFGYTTSGRKKTFAEEALQVKSAALVQDIAFKKVKGTFKYKDAKESDSTESKQPLNDVASILAWRAKNELLHSESEYGGEFFDLGDGESDNEDEYLTLSNPQSGYEQEKSTKENEERGSDEQKEIRQENGSLKDNSTDIKTNDSGYSSPTYTSHYNFQVNSEQLKKNLENIEPKKEDTSELLEKLDKELKEPAQQVTKAKNSFSEGIVEKIKEGKQYDPIRKWVEKKVAEQENADTSPAIDKNSELHKLLERDAAQLKAGVVEDERKDTLTEHNDSPDRNRIALANKNRIWAKLIAEEKQKKDGGISIG